MSEKPFFVGYLPAPGPLRTFLLTACVLLIAGLGSAGFLMGAAQDDPGPGAFRFDYGRQTVTGVVELTPYPILHVTEGNDRIQPGDSFLMTAGGKSGVDSRAEPLAGQLAQVSGVVLERGDLYMLQLRGGRNGLQAAEGEVPEITAEPQGRWKLAGEICDGKCLAGAMRPGRGLAHKACANLCLLGDVPPIFVSTQPVLGEEFLLVTGPGGTRLPRAAYDYVAQFITAEGEITKRGDLLVWEIDVDTIEVTP
ncbi:hypothetical protein [Tateyamaria omphalii]|uniref:Uncharacterized protein n=1 Tax=Tateyamaria omphalii TaxID=299262 RepID=A0A1P8MUZ2_9RHOB|nr:hypothetical protein [Tateyamaria omphalii]APX11874.1 hypothetical protein BWR18_09420 [Tateyamaria omphalii]